MAPSRTKKATITKILIADDHPLVRFALREVIGRQSNMKIVGQASTGEEAVTLALETEPDVIIMDIMMKGCGGISATRTLSSKLPGAKIIALSGYLEDKMVRKMLEAGASGFVVKSADASEILQAIKAALAGKTYLGDKVADLVIKGFVDPERKADTVNSPRLSIREQEVLRLVAEGESSKEVAVELGVSTRTVETHRFNIMKKLDIHSMSDLVKYAVREELISLEPQAGTDVDMASP